MNRKENNEKKNKHIKDAEHYWELGKFKLKPL